MPTPQPTKYERIAQSHVDSFQGTYHGSIGAAAIIVSAEEPTEEASPMLLATCSPLSRASTRSALSLQVMPAPRPFRAATTRPLPLRRKPFC